MNRTIIVMALAILICSGCATTTQKSYKTSIVITPAEQANKYTVDIQIKEIKEDRESILSSPRIIVAAGKEGRINIANQKNGEIYCSALVTNNKSRIKAVTKVTIKSEGKDDFNNMQTIIIKKIRSRNN